MVTFVADFVSQQLVNAKAPARLQIQELTANVKDPAERERIQKEVMAGVRLPKVTIGQVAEHVEHIRKLAGVDHLGLGGDYDGNTDWPEGLEDVSKYPNLFAELIRRGWSDADLKKLAGGNVLRAMRAAEAAAKRLQASRPPSTATIEELDSPGGAPFRRTCGRVCAVTGASSASARRIGGLAVSARMVMACRDAARGGRLAARSRRHQDQNVGSCKWTCQQRSTVISPLRQRHHPRRILVNNAGIWAERRAEPDGIPGWSGPPTCSPTPF
jgi:hypothetical protein